MDDLFSLDFLKGIDFEKFRVIDSVYYFLSQNKRSDYDNQIIYNLMKFLYPEKNFSNLLGV